MKIRKLLDLKLDTRNANAVSLKRMADMGLKPKLANKG
jgi:hypothetical protein